MKKYLFLLLIFFTGCVVFKNNRKTINDANSIEYNFNFTEGTKNKLLGNKNQAILNFIRCLEINPESSAVLYQLSEIYTSNGDLRSAINFSKKAYKLDENNFWYVLQLAQLYQNTESIDTTIVLYKRLISLKPADEEYSINLSFLYFKNNQAKLAIKCLKDYINKYGLTEDISVALYQIYRFTNNPEKSVAILKLAQTRFPSETRFYGLLAEHYMAINKMDSSLMYYNKLLDIDPENDRGILSLIEYYKLNSDTLNVKKYSFRFIEKPSGNIKDKYDLLSFLVSDEKYRNKYKDEIGDVIDSLVIANPNLERLQLLKADYFLRSNNYLLAKSTLIQIITKFNAKYIIWEQLLFTLNSLGHYPDLKEYSDRAITLFSDKPLPYFFNGIALYNLKSTSDAIVSFTKGLKFIKQSKDLAIQFYTYLGECYQSLGEYSKSEFNFEKALQYDPNNISVLNNYSYYLALRNQQLDKAIGYIQICIKKYPESSTYLDTYGWILFKKGEYNEAKNTVEKALKYGGNSNMEIIEHYSEILFYNGDRTNALKYYKILEENGKTNATLKELLQIQ